MALNEKIGKPSEGQAAADQVPLLSRPAWKRGGPPYFEKRGRVLPLQGGVVNGDKLPVLRFSIEQQQHAFRTDVQRVGFAFDGGGVAVPPFQKFIAARTPDGKSCVESAIAFAP